MAPVVEGTFNVGGGRNPTFEQISGKPVDPTMFSKLGLILVQAQLDGLSPREIIDKVAPHSSKMATRLNAVADDPQAFATVIAALIAAIAAIVTAMIVSSGDQPNRGEIEIPVEPKSSGELERLRDDLYDFRSAGYVPPDWSTDYIEPK